MQARFWGSIFCLFGFLGFQKLPTTPAADEQIFVEKIALAKNTSLVANTLAIGQSFLNTPYVSGTLDVPGPESLRVNLRELDCWTFVENSLAIAFTSKAEKPDFEAFKQQLQQFRYWGGTVDGFGSRIHYFSGWLLQAEKRGLLEDVTKALGGVSYRKKVNFMSVHSALYPAMKDPTVRKAIGRAENRINQRTWFYIPKAKVKKIEHLLQEGDIIATTAAKRGLDVSHQGFAVRKNGRIYLMHASSEFKKVIVSQWPLAEYLARNKGQTGIMVARIRD